MFGKKKRILVLEDEVPLSKALCIKLEAEGYETLPALNGEEALNIIAKQKKIDLAILDLVTPRIDGFGVLAKVKERYEHLPVFVVSNLSQKEDMEKALEMGASKYFVKSNISLSSIVDEAREVLSG